MREKLLYDPNNIGDIKRKKMLEEVKNPEWKSYLWVMLGYLVLLIWGIYKKKKLDQKKKD